MTEAKCIDIHGDRIAVRDEGEGEALLLIHGMAGSSRPGGQSCLCWPKSTG